MQNYAMEWKKFSSRKIKSNYPITAIRMHKTLCQDVFFDLSSDYVEVDPYKFSSAFFYDFYNISDRVPWEIFILDGVEFLHRQSGSNKPLVRDRALYSFLYIPENSTSAFAEAITTNPWLNNLCTRPVRLLSDRVAVIQNTISQISSSVVYSAILTDLDSGFTPRGIWGLDYMFAWKNFQHQPLIKVNDEIQLIPLAEYVSLFNKE